MNDDDWKAAYQGAYDELQSWKKRALSAERQLSSQQVRNAKAVPLVVKLEAIRVLPDDYYSDNMVTVFLEYFTDHPSHPADRTLAESGWTEWAVEKTNNVIRMILDVCVGASVDWLNGAVVDPEDGRLVLTRSFIVANLEALRRVPE